MAGVPTGVPGQSWQATSFLGQLSEADRRGLLTRGTLRSFAPGEALVVEGGTDTSVFVLLDGCVKVLGSAEDGGVCLLAVRGRGELVGELAAIDGQPRSATALVALPTTAREVAAAAFRDFVRPRPEAADALQRSITAKLRTATRHRIDAGGGSATVRLARTLDTLVRSHGVAVDGGGLRIAMPLSQSDLGALTGLSDASVQRALRRLRLDGAIATGYRDIEVRAPAVLRAAAAGRQT